MKMRSSIALLAASLAAFSLSSCVVPTTGYGGGYYDPGYSYDDYHYYGGGSYPSYYNRGYGGYAAGYSYYRGSSVCGICHRSPCSGHMGHSSSWRKSSGSHTTHHDHDDHRSSGHGNSSQGAKPAQYERAPEAPGKAQGTHSKEWFLSRGYSARQIEKSDGQSRGGGRNDRDGDDDKKKKSHDDGDTKKKR